MASIVVVCRSPCYQVSWARQELLIIRGNIFSRHGTHLRIACAARKETIERGLKKVLGNSLQPGAMPTPVRRGGHEQERSLYMPTS